MTPLELAALLTAVGGLLGGVWTYLSATRASRSNVETQRWKEAMELIDQLQDENARLREQTRPHPLDHQPNRAERRGHPDGDPHRY